MGCGDGSAWETLPQGPEFIRSNLVYPPSTKARRVDQNCCIGSICPTGVHWSQYVE